MLLDEEGRRVVPIDGEHTGAVYARIRNRLAVYYYGRRIRANASMETMLRNVREPWQLVDMLRPIVQQLED